MQLKLDFDQTKQAIHGRGNSAFELLYSAGWVLLFIFQISGGVGIVICALLFFFLPFDWSNILAWLALIGIWLGMTILFTWLVFMAFMMSFKLAKEAAGVTQQPRDKNGRFATIEAKSAPRVATNGKFSGYMIEGQLVPPENIKMPE